MKIHEYMQICEYMTVGKMWETPEKCGKLSKNCGKHVEKCPKNVDNCPKNVENFVDKMWECGKHVGNSFVCANVQNCRQLYKRKSIFFFNYFLFFSLKFFLLYFYNLSKIMNTIAGRGAALQLYALARRHGT